MTRTKIVEIAGRPYAVGLWWQIHSGGAAGKKVMLKEARETAVGFEKEAYSHAAIRPEQYGLCSAPEGETWPPKTASLAAALRPLGEVGRHDAFLGVFCLDEAQAIWWVCGILRGLVAAEGDECFDSKEEAFRAAAALRMTLGSVGLLEVSMDTAAESSAWLEKLLGPEPPLTPLAQKERRLGLIIGAGAAVLIAFFIGLSWAYETYQSAQASRQKALELAEKEALKQDVLTHPEKYFSRAWLTAPSVTAAGSQCTTALFTIPIAENGWSLQEAVCRPALGLTSVWAHQRGASFVTLPNGATLTSNQVATAERALNPLSGRAIVEQPLLSRDMATSILYELTQNLSGQLTLTWDAPEQFKIDESSAIPAPWQRGQFELAQIPAAAFLSPDLFAALGRYPGAMLVSLQKSNILSLRGDIYALTK